jgi:hypothetical protein
MIADAMNAGCSLNSQAAKRRSRIGDTCKKTVLDWWPIPCSALKREAGKVFRKIRLPPILREPFKVLECRLVF